MCERERARLAGCGTLTAGMGTRGASLRLLLLLAVCHRTAGRCPVGRYLDKGLSRAAGEQACVECPKGKYGRGGSNAGTCAPCVLPICTPLRNPNVRRTPAPAPTPACPAGRYRWFQHKPGSLVAGSTLFCMSCKAGTVQPATNADSCAPCAAGKFQRPYNSRTCVDCPPGKYGAAKKQTTCSTCPLGKYSPRSATGSPPTGLAFCFSCPAGKYTKGLSGTSSCARRDAAAHAAAHAARTDPFQAEHPPPTPGHAAPRRDGRSSGGCGQKDDPSCGAFAKDGSLHAKCKHHANERAFEATLRTRSRARILRAAHAAGSDLSVFSSRFAKADLKRRAARKNPYLTFCPCACSRVAAAAGAKAAAPGIAGGRRAKAATARQAAAGAAESTAASTSAAGQQQGSECDEADPDWCAAITTHDGAMHASCADYAEQCPCTCTSHARAPHAASVGSTAALPTPPKVAGRGTTRREHSTRLKWRQGASEHIAKFVARRSAKGDGKLAKAAAIIQKFTAGAGVATPSQQHHTKAPCHSGPGCPGVWHTGRRRRTDEAAAANSRSFCGAPPIVPNAQEFKLKVRGVLTIRYICDTGYELVGMDNASCGQQLNWQWSQPPSCRAESSKCGKPPQIPHGKAVLALGHSSAHWVAEYTCAPGYEIASSSTASAHCDEQDHTWSPPPGCVMKDRMYATAATTAKPTAAPWRVRQGSARGLDIRALLVREHAHPGPAASATTVTVHADADRPRTVDAASGATQLKHIHISRQWARSTGRVGGGGDDDGDDDARSAGDDAAARNAATPLASRGACLCNVERQRSRDIVCELRHGSIHVRHKGRRGSLRWRTDSNDRGPGAGHSCKVVHGSCSCCECDNRGLPPGFESLGAGYMAAARPFLSKHVIHSPNLAACEQACADELECKVGTYVSSFDGDGQCWLSKHGGTHARGERRQKKCDQPCESFQRKVGSDCSTLEGGC